jgi:nucleoside-diphosphate-sugar epimerase
MKKIVIIGGAGYIGTVLTGYLLSKGHQVIAIDKFLYQNNYCIHSYLGNPNYKFLFGDMRDKNFTTEILKSATDVIILAGLVGDPITKKYPKIAHAINDIGIKNFIDNCNGKKIDRLIFISTCSNYGFIDNDKLADEDFELKPLSLYSKSKVEVERYIIGLKGKVDYHPTILRFATAFGLSPRMRFDLTVSEFVNELAMGNELLVYDPHTWRPYCHVQDFSRLMLMVLEANFKTVSFEVFNSGGEENNFTKKGIVDLILSKVPDGVVKYQEHGADPRNYRVDFTKVNKKLGFKPKFSIMDGVIELLHSIKNQTFDNSKNFEYGNYNIHYDL